jgi:Flp pilus assembly protein TadD
MTTRNLGTYRLVEMRARGRTGVVHEAVDTARDQPVELIELPEFDASDNALWSAFLGVMGRLSSADIDAIATPNDFARTPEEGAWYVTDAPRGISLEELRGGLGRLHWRQAAMILHQIARALSFAHSRGVAHGNLTPRAVYIDSVGTVQIRRFAVLARVRLEVSTGKPVSLAEIYDGTDYLSPEALAHRSPNLASDVFALGLLAFELLAGRHPFGGVTGVVAHVEAKRDPPDPSAEAVMMPASIRDLVMNMLRVRVDQRPADAGAVVEVLRDQLRDVGVIEIQSSLAVELNRQRSLFAAASARAPSPRPGSAARTPGEGRDLGSVGGAGEKLSKEAEAIFAEMMVAASHTRQRPDRSPGRAAVVLVALLLTGAGFLYFTGTQRQARRATQEALGLNQPAAAGSMVPSPRASPLDDLPDAELAQSPETDVAAVLLAKGLASLEQGQVARAERLARRGLERGGPSQVPLHMLLARSLERQARIDDAVASYLASDKAAFDQTAGRLAAGFLLGSDGRCKEAVEVYQSAYRAGLDSSRLHALLGSCQLLLGALEDAVTSLERALVKGVADVDVLMPLATSLDLLGEMDQARAVYERVLRLRPRHARARAAVDRIDALRADPVEAAKWLAERRDQAASEDPQALGVEAFAAFTAGQHERAAALYQKIVDAAGDDATAEQLKNLAVALDRTDKAERAIAALQRALQKTADDKEMQLLLGHRLTLIGRHSEAVEHLEKAAEDPALRFNARFDLGLAALASGDARRAVVEFGALAAERPEDLRAVGNLAKAQVEAGQDEAALATLERVSRLEPHSSGSWLTRAAILQRMDRRDEADALLVAACGRGIQEACR